MFVSRPLHVNGRNIFRANYGECCRERTAMCCRHQRLSLLCAGARWLPGDRLDAHGVRRQSCAGLSWRKSDSTQYQVRGFLFGYLVPTQLPDLPHNCRVSSFVCRITCFFNYQANGAGNALRSSISLPLAGYLGNLTDGASVQARVVYLQDGLLAALRRLDRRSSKQSDCGGRGAPVVDEQEERALRPRTNVRPRTNLSQA